MKIDNLQDALAAFRKLQQTLAAYDHAMGVLYLDATTAAPKDTWEGRGKTMEIMSQLVYDLTASDDNGELFSYLQTNGASLDPQTRRELEVLKKQYDQMKRIPAREYVEYSVLLNDAQNIWQQAKNEDNFSLFAPCLEKIVDFNLKFAHYYNPDKAPYDALLGEYEEGMDTATLDVFFGKLRGCIASLLERIAKKQQPSDDFMHLHYPIALQREFSDHLMEVLGLDRDHCAIAETEHPYTTNFNSKDVRITTHYHEDDLASSMYSVIHEGGHALYELGADEKYDYTALSGGVSMGIHESQSRFYENIIGRSRAFIHCIFPEVCRLFPGQMEGVSEEDFYRAVNKAQPSLVRTEADELSYCNHVMVRYEIEKQLIDGSLSVADVPQRWNALYKEYLGIEVPNDRLGCLQDSHWSGGSIGYFPSYALGSAYGVQMLHVMTQDLGDIYADVEKGDLSRITGWLKDKIHRHASFIKPVELFESVCGKFDPDYYIRYLTDKFTELYDL